MYHTLLPQQVRRSIRREYRMKALTVLLFALSIAGLIGIVSLFPAFIRATLDAKASGRDLASIQSEFTERVNLVQKKVTDGGILLSQLSKKDQATRLSSWVQSVASQKGSVKINTLNVTQVGTTSTSILVKGVAPSRESLLAFKQRIEAAIPGSKSELPLSTLAKGTDIDFSLDFVIPIKK